MPESVRVIGEVLLWFRQSDVLSDTSSTQICFVEQGLGNPPLPEELSAPVVFFDLTGAPRNEMINKTIAYSNKAAATGMPHFHAKVVVATHTGTEVSAEAANSVPPASVDDGGRPRGTEPVRL